MTSFPNASQPASRQNLRLKWVIGVNSKQEIQAIKKMIYADLMDEQKTELLIAAFLGMVSEALNDDLPEVSRFDVLRNAFECRGKEEQRALLMKYKKTGIADWRAIIGGVEI